jgi:hypothetical protein
VAAEVIPVGVRDEGALCAPARVELQRRTGDAQFPCLELDEGSAHSPE